MVGALIPKSVQLTTTFVFRLKDTKLDLQTQLFDTIMPNLLPLVFTLFCFIMLKKWTHADCFNYFYCDFWVVRFFNRDYIKRFGQWPKSLLFQIFF